jgi:hypothetical protein
MIMCFKKKKKKQFTCLKLINNEVFEIIVTVVF